MKKFLKNNDKWLYFILTFLISWPIWIAGKVLLPENLTIITLILGAFGPFIAALILLRITRGSSGLKEWFKINFNFRIKIIWYLLGGIILPFLIAAVHHLIYLGFGGKSGIELSPDWLLIYCIPLSMILTWLYYKSKRSIIPVMLLHAGTNVVFSYFPMETKVFENVDDEFTLMKTIVYFLFAIVLLVITRGSLGYENQISNRG